MQLWKSNKQGALWVTRHFHIREGDLWCWMRKRACNVLVYMPVFIRLPYMQVKGKGFLRHSGWSLKLKRKLQTQETGSPKYKSHLSLCTNHRKYVFFLHSCGGNCVYLCEYPDVHTHTHTPTQMTVVWTRLLTIDSRVAETHEGSRDESEWPGHYSATTNNSPQDKESFVTGAALTNSVYCAIKLANILLPLCDTERDESPQGKPVGESLLLDKHFYRNAQEGALNHMEVLRSFEM